MGGQVPPPRATPTVPTPTPIYATGMFSHFSQQFTGFGAWTLVWASVTVLGWAWDLACPFLRPPATCQAPIRVLSVANEQNAQTVTDKHIILFGVSGPPAPSLLHSINLNMTKHFASPQYRSHQKSRMVVVLRSIPPYCVVTRSPVLNYAEYALCVVGYTCSVSCCAQNRKKETRIQRFRLPRVLGEMPSQRASIYVP